MIFKFCNQTGKPDSCRELRFCAIFWMIVALPGFALAQEPSVTPEGQSKFPALEIRKWSGSINVPDPVALSVDDQGRIFVTQTKRRKIQDLDIRQHPQWIADDLGLTSVAEKSALFKRLLAVGGDQALQSQEVQDWNKDGQFDWRDLGVVSEVIYRLEDTDSDGTADKIDTFAEDFNTEVTGIAAGVLAYEGDVYATIAPDVWKLRDTDGDGSADERTSIATGFGLHIAYAGHDMHGLTIGPDGKIYWSIGDKGINVTSPEGKTFAYPHEGGVMRCNPDGSDFEVFARGLRNLQEPAFNQYGDLFGVDNDSDNPGELERFTMVVGGMDAGWRCYYQHRADDYNPWMAEGLWDVGGENHPASIVPPIRHYVDGPAGFKFNPGTALSAAYKDFFFLTSAPNGQQYAFRVEPKGETYAMVDEHLVGSGVAIVGLAFGPDGGLYGADWDGGYPLDQKGSVVRIDVTDDFEADDEFQAARREVQTLLSAGFAKLEKPSLLAMLPHADMRIRQGAQFELVRRQESNALAAVATSDSASLLARLHATWGLGQLARQGDLLGRDVLGLLMRADNERLRGQAAKTYGDQQNVDATPLMRLLTDDSPYVRMQAGIALARHPSAKATETLLKQAEKLTFEDHYQRHAIVSALATCAAAEELAAQVEQASVPRRLCSLLALRKQTHPLAARFLNDTSDWVATEAARAIHDDASIPDALPELASALQRDAVVSGKASEAFIRRAINANFRLGDVDSASRVVEFASLNSASENTDKLRAVALDCLTNWTAPGVLDRVQGIRRDLPLESRTLDEQQLGELVTKLVEGQNKALRQSAIAAAQQLNIELPLDLLQRLVRDAEAEDATRVMALHALHQKLTGLIAEAAASDSEALRVRAMELATVAGSAAQVSRLVEVLQSDASDTTKQAALRILRDSPNEAAIEAVVALVDAMLAGDGNRPLGLESLEALSALSESNVANAAAASESLKQTLAWAEATMGSEQLAKFAFSRDGGDTARGETLFNTHVEAQCSRCHRIGKLGSNIGPPLTKVAAQRDADYLLRSIVSPSADIDDKFRTELVLLDSGQVLKGVVQSETETEVVVADAAGKLTTIATEQIEERSAQKVSLMPELAEILSPAEVRDLVAYLKTLK